MAEEPKGVKIISEAGDHRVSEQDAESKLRHRVKGLPRDVAMSLFHHAVDLGWGVSIKHLGGYYFVEFPVGLRGDPVHNKHAEIQTLARRAGGTAIQTGQTMRIVG